MRKLIRLFALVVIGSWGVVSRSTGQNFAPLVDRLPNDTNVLVLIDAQKVRSSPMAEREGWSQDVANRVGRQTVIALPGTRRMVVGASLDLASLRVLSEVSIMSFGRAPLLDTIAKNAGGQREQLSGRDVLWTPNDTYFIDIDTNSIAAVYPANRQFAARWLKFPGGPMGGPASKYLRDRLLPDPSAPIVLAMDLQDAISIPRTIQSFVIEPPETFSPTPADVQNLAKILASAKGLSVAMNVSDKITADAQITFAEDCAPLRPYAKPLLIDLVSRNGLYLSEINDWTVTVRENTVRATGELTSDGMRRLLGLVVTPAPTLNSATAQRGNGAEANLQTKLYASQNYYRAVSRIIDRFKPVNVLSQSAGWLTRDAREIHGLPILNVDPDLLRWGGDVSSQLMAMSQIFSEGQARVESRAASVQFPTGPFNYNSWDTSGANEAADAQRRAATDNARNQQRMAANEEKARVLQESRSVLAKIFKDREDVRAKMAQKYGAEF